MRITKLSTFACAAVVASTMLVATTRVTPAWGVAGHGITGIAMRSGPFGHLFAAILLTRTPAAYQADFDWWCSWVREAAAVVPGSSRGTRALGALQSMKAKPAFRRSLDDLGRLRVADVIGAARHADHRSLKAELAANC